MIKYEELNKKEKLLANSIDQNNFKGITTKEYIRVLNFLINKKR